ncbi:hypothetical protein [Streptomyces sp. NBC_00076]|uniref:hypothetical protein n=1 Tax=Streptomyces sp. NBC_00076 TaxID=2975642 RepID=UPI003246E882
MAVQADREGCDTASLFRDDSREHIGEGFERGPGPAFHPHDIGFGPALPSPMRLVRRFWSD